MPKLLGTDIQGFRKLFAANSTANSFAALNPTATEPVEGSGVVRTPAVGGLANNQAVLWFFGADAADEVFTARVTGWSRVEGLWLPSKLWEGNVTLGTKAGVAGQPVLNTDLVADTVSQAFGHANTVVLSPADNTPASVVLDVLGSHYVQVQTSITTAASANVLARFI